MTGLPDLFLYLPWQEQCLDQMCSPCSLRERVLSLLLPVDALCQLQYEQCPGLACFPVLEGREKSLLHRLQSRRYTVRFSEVPIAYIAQANITYLGRIKQLSLGSFRL